MSKTTKTPSLSIGDEVLFFRWTEPLSGSIWETYCGPYRADVTKVGKKKIDVVVHDLQESQEYKKVPLAEPFDSSFIMRAKSLCHWSPTVSCLAIGDEVFYHKGFKYVSRAIIARLYFSGLVDLMTEKGLIRYLWRDDHAESEDHLFWNENSLVFDRFQRILRKLK